MHPRKRKKHSPCTCQLWEKQREKAKIFLEIFSLGKMKLGQVYEKFRVQVEEREC